MASCDRVERCPLFKHFSLQASLVVWTTRYCNGEFSRCERLKRATAGQTVPSNLLPNGKLLAVPLEQANARDTGAV